MQYLLNAFSLNMVQAQNMHLVKFKPISLNDATMLTNSVDFTSAIGHQDMANVVSSMLGMPITMNRISVELKPGDIAIVAQYKGDRLAEGATKLPENAVIEWIEVSL